MVLLETEPAALNSRAIDFSLPDPQNKQWTLENCRGENGLLIMFVCNHCPYVQAILDDLVSDVAKLKKIGINSVAIMANDIQEYPDDAPDKMHVLAERYQFSFPYLYDETQEIAKAYGAVCTPDFFGYNKDLKLQYRGRFNSHVGMKKTNESVEPELYHAMVQIAQTGSGPKEQTPGIGCSIKWKSD